MKDLWRFIKSSGIYFVGTVLTKLISFLLLPLYTSYISPADYGTYDFCSSAGSACRVSFLAVFIWYFNEYPDFGGIYCQRI